MFHASMSNQCEVVSTTARQRHEEIRRVIAEGLDRDQSLPAFGASESSTIGCSFGSHGDSRASRDAGASWS